MSSEHRDLQSHLGKTMKMKLLWSSLVLVGSLISASAAIAAEPAEKVIDHVSRRVAKIFGAGGIRGLHAYSTGFLVSSKGHLVTVWSHVLDDQAVTVVLQATTLTVTVARLESIEPSQAA